MTRTSRARHLNIVEPSPHRHGTDTQEPPAQEPPAEISEVPQPDSAADQADLDAALTGMSVLLRVALRLMKSSGTGGR